MDGEAHWNKPIQHAPLQTLVGERVNSLLESPPPTPTPVAIAANPGGSGELPPSPFGSGNSLQLQASHLPAVHAQQC